MRRNSVLIERSDLICLGIIAAFFLIFTWRISLRAELPLIGDPFAYTLPMRQVMWEMLRNGALPLWTPYIFSGYPLLSMAQLGIGYPLTWGYLFLPPPWAETIYVVAPFLLSPAFLYAYARTVGRSRIASLIAGLSFAYGGMMASKLSNGMLPNAVMWLPLVLIAIERSRRGRLLLCIVGAASAYSMSVLTGIGQGIVLVGIVAGTYSIFIAALDLRSNGWSALKPVAVAIAAALLAIGVSAFQIFESLPAVRLSVRSELTYELFGQLSLPVLQSLKTFWVPIYYHIESAPFLPPLIMMLALVGAVVTIRNFGASQQALYWLALAVISALLIPGIYSPFYRVLYYVPILNKFRGSSRHTFGFTLGLSILAAFGFDFLRMVHGRLREKSRSPGIIAIALALLSALIAAFWFRNVASHVPILSEQALFAAGRSYALFKLAFVLPSSIVCWLIWKMEISRRRSALLIISLLAITFVEATMFMTYSWAYPAVPSKWFNETRRPMEFLQKAVSPSDRVYMRAVGFDARDLDADNLDFLNLSARRKLQNIAGYEPLITQRYSRALGDVWLDGVRSKLAGPAGFSLFYPKNHVLDLLSTRYVAGYSNFEVIPPRAKEVDGVRFSSLDFDPQGMSRLTSLEADGDRLAVVSYLSHSTHISEGTPVARLTIHSRDGRILERDLLAGRDTAEWAHDRADVRQSVRHGRAKVFDRHPVDAEPRYDALRFVGYIEIGERVSLDYLDIRELIPGVPVMVSKVTIVDQANRTSTPLIGLRGSVKPAAISWMHDAARWKKVYDRDEVLILENRRALPRAWLTGAARVVSADESLALITGESSETFDPKSTVLLEANIPELSSLPQTSLPNSCTAKVTSFESNSLTIRTSCESYSILVVSEMNYPGWEATIDDRKLAIQTADYLLRGIAVPAGEHVVEMRYAAPFAQRGAIVSICTLALLGVMFGVGRKPVRRDDT